MKLPYQVLKFLHYSSDRAVESCNSGCFFAEAREIWFWPLD